MAAGSRPAARAYVATFARPAAISAGPIFAGSQPSQRSPARWSAPLPLPPEKIGNGVCTGFGYDSTSTNRRYLPS